MTVTNDLLTNKKTYGKKVVVVGTGLVGCKTACHCTKVLSLEDGKVIYEKAGKKHTLEADTVVIAAGYKENRSCKMHFLTR